MNKISILANKFESSLKIDAAATEDIATTVLSKEQRQLATDTLIEMRRNVLNMLDKNPTADIAQSLNILNTDIVKLFEVFISKKPI